MLERKPIGKFTARDDVGNSYTILEYQDRDITRKFGRRKRVMQTDKDELVDYIENGKYEVHRATGVISVTSDDPKAP